MKSSPVMVDRKYGPGGTEDEILDKAARFRPRPEVARFTRETEDVG